MNKEKLQQFDALVHRQESGDSTAMAELEALSPSLEDGYCLYNVYEQWKGAFSFSPGVTKALPRIVRLTEKMSSYEKDDTLRMYTEPEWKELVDLRGPFECAIRYTCGDCKKEYIGFGQSGFDDRYPSVCETCGDVWMQSGYDEEALPQCHCGGTYRCSGCPHCGSTQIESKEYFSSYEYFVDHNWKDKSQQGGGGNG